MTTLLRAAGLTVLLLGLVATAHAERADRNQPMAIEADKLHYDDLKQLSVFSGNVQIIKGSILIRGDQVEVRQDPEGYQFGLVTAEPGKLAFFRQKRNGVDETIEGEGEVIEYDGRTDKVTFIRKAQLRRFRGATLGDEVHGSVIQYDNVTDVFSVDGGAAQGGPATSTGRVRAVLTPRNEAAAPAAPASAAAEGGVGLRPATRLGGSKP